LIINKSIINFQAEIGNILRGSGIANQTTKRYYLFKTNNETRRSVMKLEDSVIFERGELNPYGKHFSGTSYLNMLTLEGVVTANVTFEPGCINNWHTHKADKNGGQILLITGGRGWYQEEGKEARELHAGDVVYIPSGIKHWHGAAKDSWFVHIAVEIPGENASTEWHEPVDINDYNKLK
jgi:quercetin dioxygenase-like cupin family protein